MCTTCHLLEKIEDLREEMENMVSHRGLTCPDLLALSKTLDHLLNVYSCYSVNQEYLEGYSSTEY